MTSARRIVIVTCREWPALSVSDSALAAELRRRGHTVVALPWNDAPLDGFTSADAVILRSNWDFHHDLASFDHWLVEVDKSSAELHNPAAIVRRFNHKSYLHDFAGLGIPTPATLRVDSFDDGAISKWMQQRGFDSVVIKPAWGASGHNVERIRRVELGRARARWEAEPDRRDVLVQEFVPDISNGETALVFFGHRFSHALHRQPDAQDFRVNSQYGGTMTLASHVDREARALAEAVMGTIPAALTYARVDIVGSGSTVRLMELEVNEPALGLHLAPGSAVRFADALLSPSDRRGSVKTPRST